MRLGGHDLRDDRRPADANQTFREIMYGVVSARAEDDVKPRVFFEDFPNRVLYVRDMPPAAAAGTTSSSPTPPTRISRPSSSRGAAAWSSIARSARSSWCSRTARATRRNLDDPAKYEVTRFGEFIIGLDPKAVFPRTEILKGDNEMTIAELRARVAELQAAGLSAAQPDHGDPPEVLDPGRVLRVRADRPGARRQQRRDGKLASFVLGIGVVFVYYVLDYLGRR